MLNVSHKITIGSAQYTSADHTRLVDMQARPALDVPVNTCRLVLAPPDDLSVATADEVTVEIGYDDNLELIFTGIAGAVDWGIESVSIEAVGSVQRLLAARLNHFYEKPKAGDIVSDVLSRFGLSSGNVESGIDFPAYVLGENQPAYDHLRTLAQQCGFDLYADTEDKVVFAAYRAASTHAFEYGKNILALEADERAVPVTGVEVYGESPASHGQGTEAYSWLTKKEVKGSAGDTSGIVQRFTDPTACTLEAAGQMAKAAFAVAGVKRRGVMKVLGAPAVKLGDAVKISGMPVESQNGTFKVTGIQHRINVKNGFLTSIRYEEAA